MTPPKKSPAELIDMLAEWLGLGEVVLDYIQEADSPTKLMCDPVRRAEDLGALPKGSRVFVPFERDGGISCIRLDIRATMIEEVETRAMVSIREHEYVVEAEIFADYFPRLQKAFRGREDIVVRGHDCEVTMVLTEIRFIEQAGDHSTLRIEGIAKEVAYGGPG